MESPLIILQSIQEEGKRVITMFEIKEKKKKKVFLDTKEFTMWDNIAIIGSLT